MQRERWERDRATCKRCGNPLSECSDPEKVWYPQQTICYATMEREAAQARWARLHEEQPWHDGTHSRWASKPSKEAPYHRDYGTSIWVSSSDLGLGGDFLRLATTDGTAERIRSDEAIPDEADTSPGI